MADPVGDARLETGEKVVEHGDLVTEEHEAVDQMGADEACATCDEDALTPRLGEKLNRGETAEGGVGDEQRLREVNRLELVSGIPLCEVSMVIGLFGIDALRLFLVRGQKVVWTEVERSDHVEGDLAVKPEALETDRGDFFAALVEGSNLCSVQRKEHISGSTNGERIGRAVLTDCGDGDGEVMLRDDGERSCSQAVRPPRKTGPTVM
jgi:hypothetical protein